MIESMAIDVAAQRMIWSTITLAIILLIVAGVSSNKRKLLLGMINFVFVIDIVALITSIFVYIWTTPSIGG